MQILLFLFALLFTLPASAESAIRCGTDAFGNAVCMDKDGAVRAAPVKSKGDRPGGEGDGKSSAGGSEDESGIKQGRENQAGQVRCGIDPFGNTVCR
jgi:hypothetical protein